jgi:hypothetical protein
MILCWQPTEEAVAVPQRKPGKKEKVKTTFRKAARTPSKRLPGFVHPSHFPVAKTPQGLSPLAAYIEDNLDTGISVRELIEQFQEYDCGLIQKKYKPGAKPSGETDPEV